MIKQAELLKEYDQAVREAARLPASEQVEYIQKAKRKFQRERAKLEKEASSNGG